MNRRWHRVRPILGLSLVLLTGMLLGGVITWRLFLPQVSYLDHLDAETMAAYVTGRLSETLGLSSEQRPQLLNVVRNHIHQFREIRKKINPEVDQLRSESRLAVRSILNDQQKKVFDALVAEHNRRLLLLAGPPTE